MTTVSPPRRARLRDALLLSAVAVALRVAAALLAERLPVVLVPDEILYHELASALLGGGPAAADPRLLFVSPLYPALVALAGGTAHAVWLQLAAGVGVPAALYWTAASASGERLTGWLAGGLALLHGPLLAFDAVALPVALSIDALALALALDYRREPLSHGRALTCGCAFAFAVLCSPSTLLIPFAWVAFRRPWRLATATLLLLPLTLGLAALSLRNAELGAGFAPLGLNSGITLAHGNLQGSSGGYVALPGSDASKRNQHLHARARAQRERSGSDQPKQLSWGAVDAHWRNRTLASLIDQPGRAAKLFAAKLWLFAGHDFVGDEVGYRSLREQWPVLRVLPAGFVLLLILAATAAASGRRWPHGSTAIATAVLAANLVFYVSDRYRLPAAVALCIPAAYGLRDLLGRSRRARTLGLTGVAMLALVHAAWPAPPAERQLHSLRAAEAAEWRGDSQRAVALYRELLKQQSTPATVHALARALLKTGAPTEAVALLDGAFEAGDLGEVKGELANDRGVAALRLGHMEQAQVWFLQARSAEPAVPEADLNLGKLAESREAFEEAVQHYRAYTRARPDQPGAWLGLARSLHRSGGQPERARAAAQRVARTPTASAGQLSAAANLEGVLLREAGQLDLALERFQQAARLMPAAVAPQHNLARDASERGDQRAAERFRAAARSNRK